jgi:uncharacterized protein
MQAKLLHGTGGQRTFAVVLATGDEVMSSLQDFINREKISAAAFTAIGALSDAVLLYFDWDKKSYQKIPVNEQVEVASMIGDVAEGPDGTPSLHIHLVVGTRGGAAMAGHLGAAHVRPTLEVVITESPAHLRKVKDAETGLALIRLAA